VQTPESEALPYLALARLLPDSAECLMLFAVRQIRHHSLAALVFWAVVVSSGLADPLGACLLNVLPDVLRLADDPELPVWVDGWHAAE
jgi:hypothetical protein